MARPIWTGNLSFGLLNVPVSLMPGERKIDLHFRLLDSRNNTPIRYERINADTGEEATSVTSWSLRARPDAAVAVPLCREELGRTQSSIWLKPNNARCRYNNIACTNLRVQYKSTGSTSNDQRTLRADLS